MKSFKEIMAYNQEHNDILTNELLATLDKEEEYVKDNDIYCKRCNQRRTRFGFKTKIRILCQCQAEERDRQAERDRQSERQRRIAELRRASLLGDEYQDATFDKADMYSDNFAAVFARCKKYCAVAEKVLEKGHGIYIFGDHGTGKTHLTACMANDLLSQGYPVLYTSIGEISKFIRSTYDKKGMTEQEFMARLRDVDFLFLDDFGTERVTKNDEDLWLQEKVFEVVNSRYNALKPTIFTSNYSLVEMVNNRGLSGKTADRIRQKCVMLELKGKSYRAEKKNKTEFDF